MKRLLHNPCYDTSNPLAKREAVLVEVERPFLGLIGAMNRKQLRETARKLGVRRGRDDNETRNNLTYFFHVQCP